MRRFARRQDEFWNGLAAMVAVGGLLGTGCAQLPSFPIQPVQPQTRIIAFDMDEDGQDDYWQELDAAGRKVTLRFDDDRDGQADTTARLDEPPSDDTLHVVIIVDGVPYDLAAALYAEGRFRLLGPPARLITTFPAMTDLALAQAFGAGPCLGYEALYFDTTANRMSNGNRVYLDGANAPWTPAVDYRCSSFWDVKTYLDPAAVWRHELEGFQRTIEAADEGTVYLYTVATAGLGTRGGQPAMREYLDTLEAWCERVTWQRRGAVRFSIFADHGHGLRPCRRIKLREPLKDAGFRVAKTLGNDSDVVIPEYGLVTCAVMHTRSPQRVAEVLVGQQAVDLVLYRPADSGNPDSITVLSATGQATIGHTNGRYSYEASVGDPLHLTPVVALLRSAGLVAEDGTVAADDWLEATAHHVYPDAPARIWCGFEPGCLVENPADVIVSLKEGYACGSGFFAAMCNIESTHGTLAASSTTMLMSNAVDPPAVLRLQDLVKLLKIDPPQ